MAIRDCGECGKPVSTLAPACPHCGAPQRQLEKRPSVLNGAWIVLAICIGIYFVFRKPSPEPATTESTASDAQPAMTAPAQSQPLIQIPYDETRFIQIVSGARSQSEQAANDMQRGGIKHTRDQTLCSERPGTQVDRWIGTVDKVDSNSDGKGVLSIRIAEGMLIKTWNNEFSDISDHTLIEPGSALFSTASQLAKGQSVQFSGHLFRGTEGDCFREGSLTLRGKLTEPEFIFSFSSVGAPTAPSASARPPSAEAAASRLPTPSAPAIPDNIQQIRQSWASAVAKHLQPYWNRPLGIADDLRSYVKISLLESGDVADVRLSKSSGNPAFDNSVLLAVRRASPFPLPTDSRAFERNINLDFLSDRPENLGDIARNASTQADRITPSFDCNKARSPSEVLICNDPELATLDRNLADLNNRAREAASDKDAFKRAGREAWQRREATCSDRDCLVVWFAERRADLENGLRSSNGAL